MCKTIKTKKIRTNAGNPGFYILFFVDDALIESDHNGYPLVILSIASKFAANNPQAEKNISNPIEQLSINDSKLIVFPGFSIM